MKEIERKFLISQLPDLRSIKPIRQERYYLKQDLKEQVRVQRKEDSYELETKIWIGPLQYEKHKKKISKEEFEEYKKNCERVILRDSYTISIQPKISIKIYHGEQEGFMRAEIEFESIEAAQNYPLPEWVGKEITDTALGLDAQLILLTKKEIQDRINKLSKDEENG